MPYPPSTDWSPYKAVGWMCINWMIMPPVQRAAVEDLSVFSVIVIDMTESVQLYNIKALISTVVLRTPVVETNFRSFDVVQPSIYEPKRRHFSRVVIELNVPAVIDQPSDGIRM